MSYFYFTPLGAIFFYTLLVICLFAIWRGGKERIFAFLVAYVFLSERTLLLAEGERLISGEWMIGLGGAAAFIGLMAIYMFTSGLASRVIMFLFAAKIAMYISLILGKIEFGTMAAWTELAAYGQLAIIGSGALHGITGKRKLGSYFLSGFAGFRSRSYSGKSGMASERRSGSLPTSIP